ncbi:uncharacterized protein LOC121406094 [Lytechinus variegatus]|uniref:uncharacterized protein LOC121406094 n=1 Tax=Lytechinus variegatus TaxID=7654 RepID=UPI001BB1B401|nr:uncharacterized protein LOC121406094 [Lytechinus variegatus]
MDLQYDMLNFAHSGAKKKIPGQKFAGGTKDLNHNVPVALPRAAVSRTKVSQCAILPPAPGNPGNMKPSQSVCDLLDGDQLDSIAKGLRNNERLPKMKKGVNIAGRQLGKVRPKRRRKDSRESANDVPPVTVASRKKTRRSGKIQRSNQRAEDVGSSDRAPSHRQGHQEKRRRRRRRKRPHPEPPPPEGQIRRNEQLHILATNPCRSDRLIEHKKAVEKQFGSHSTQLTEPQMKIRKRRRSNSVKDPQMDFDL